MSNVLQTLGVETLSLRGYGTEFNSFSRFFKSKDEGLLAVATNDYVPEPGKINAVLMLGEGIMVWSFELLDFVNITELSGAGTQSPKYIELDGVDDYISFPNLAGGSENALDWSQDWSLGVTLVGVEPGYDGNNVCLFRNGGCSINLKRGGSNWGLYVTSDDNLFDSATRAQANTWYAPGDFSRILFTYCSATQRLKYFLGEPVSGTYAMRANLFIPTSMVSGQNHGTELQVGKSWSGPGGAYFSGAAWDGGVNNLIVSGTELIGPQIDEFFQTGEDFTTHEYYSDIAAYCRLGEDTYPDVVDDKGNMTNGELVNGSAEDFKDIPTVES